MNILVVCSGGMSTSLLVESMKKAAEKEGVECQIQSGSAALVSEEAPKYDIILVAPQVRHKLRTIEEAVSRHKKTVTLIPPEMYGKIQGERLLSLAIELLKPCP